MSAVKAIKLFQYKTIEYKTIDVINEKSISTIA